MAFVSQNKEEVLGSLKRGDIDAVVIGHSNLSDEIILEMYKKGLVDRLAGSLLDKRAENQSIPIELFLTLAIAAKMKQRTSLTDIPFAITDAETLSAIGWNYIGQERPLDEGLMSEGAVRHFVNKYESDEFIQCYNDYIQKQVFPHLQMSPDIHILDCTLITVPLENENYEQSEIIKYKGELYRGYKLASIRGIVDDTGIIEEIELDSINTHDLELSRDMVMNCSLLKPGDILINDRGFISRDLMNFLKIERGVDIYMPLRKNMDAFEQAVSLAKEKGSWMDHPNEKREGQKISFVGNLGPYWRSKKPSEDVDFNACVVYDTKEEEYFVFITTNLNQTARVIVSTYELRPEIEEDFRQIKDFWEIEDFKSTKFNVIAFHIVMLLIGYMFFQVYTTTEEGNEYFGSTLPVAAKRYISKKHKKIIIYSGAYFALFSFLEVIELLINQCSKDVFNKMRPVLASV